MTLSENIHIDRTLQPVSSMLILFNRHNTILLIISIESSSIATTIYESKIKYIEEQNLNRLKCQTV